MSVPYVFVDTSVFIRENFLDGSGINALLEKGERNEVKLYITEIVLREILKNYRERYEIARNQLNKVSVLKNIPEFKEHLEKLIKSDLNQQIIEFERILTERLKKANVEILPLVPKNVEIVMGKYFAQTPPFGIGKQKEFPDAFIIQVLEEEAKKSGVKIIVVSGDTDFEGLNSKWLSFDKLENILNLITINSSSKNEIESIEKLVYKEELGIKDCLEEFLDNDLLFDFPEIWDYYLEEVNVEDFKIKNVLIEHLKKYTVLAYIEVDTVFRIRVSYLDNEMAYYDKEDDKYIGGEDVSEEYIVKTSFPITLEADVIENEGLDYITIKSINNKKKLLIDDDLSTEIIGISRKD